MPAVATVVAGTEPRRRRGGVRLMLNRVTSLTMFESRIHLNLPAPIYALRVIVALPRAIGISPLGTRAARVALAAHGILLGRILRAGAGTQETHQGADA